jgi:Alginate lyase/RTX calcium-binding nonapeptide repeat (4 copies)
MALNPAAAPSGNFDLSNWKITLPVDASGSTSGTAVEVKSLSGYQNSKYFYTGSDGAMTFYAPVEGATTSGSNYARSELREMNGSSTAAWKLSTGGTMSATLEVDAAPMRTGEGHKLVIGQIHGQNDELVRLYWQDNKLHFNNDLSGSDNKEHSFTFAADDGSQPDVSLHEKFSYTISVKNHDLNVDIYADGKVYHSHTTVNAVWDNDTFYFKAGAYLGANETNGSGYGQTAFYGLAFNHNGTVTTPTPVPTSPVPTTPVPTPVPQPDPQTTGKTVSGTSGADKLTGTIGADRINGLAGSDTLWGKEGSDILTGGTGKDLFTFDTKLGSTNVDRITDFNVADDTIRLNDNIFTKLIDDGELRSSWFRVGEKALDANDYIVYNKSTGALSYDADGSGSGAAVQFATIDNKVALTYHDFIVI